MVDPQTETGQTVQAQHTMARRYDVIPFAQHDLMREATRFAKNLYHHIHHFAWTDEQVIRDVAIVDALTQWSESHFFSLFIIQDLQFAEQTFYRLTMLAKSIIPLVS